MYKKVTFLSLFAAASLFGDSELDALKAQLKQQQEMTQKLLEKVNKLETKEAQEEAESENTALANAYAQDTSSSFSQNAYLPDIALIMNMSAVGRNVKNSDYENFAIPGFVDAGDAELPFNKERGFNLNYAEVAMHSMVDPYFEAFAIFHLHPDEFEIEEAYVTTTSLSAGLRVKAGKFRSAFGRINEKHQHSWNFDEQPIIYKALFGPDMISDPGLQVQWVAPTDTYIMAGVDAMQGSNDRSFGDVEKNNLYVGYIKSSLDLTDDLSVLGGVSFAHGKTDLEKDSDVYGVDLTFREQFNSYSALTWQSEYLQRNKDTNATVNPTQKQGGFYSELIYQYNNNYSAGIRYEKIIKNDTDLSAYNGINTDNLDKYTAMLQYKPFPFSRLRLEYSHDRTKVINDQRKDVDSVMMTLNIAAGAHGAHAY
ncbi:outer membrane beta-barrel protein [Sulfurimonas paralvinellae]|uniref:Outer membrane beta-barrel protein n=1 Tax=Sulfurimonas paralvinellae TaxID=317658 RepID=A0A7M1BAZ1_9BACT|nr:outer membrane beta-barrel protein [Sulfurimonas paralvinellae]QOP45932.1 outer membrane beta-barrel protein [Sulfurimonas paralvinellae]